MSLREIFKLQQMGGEGMGGGGRRSLNMIKIRPAHVLEQQGGLEQVLSRGRCSSQKSALHSYRIIDLEARSSEKFCHGDRGARLAASTSF